MEKKQLTQKEELKQQFIDRLQLDCSVSPDEASDSQIYQVLSAMICGSISSTRPIPSAERKFIIFPWNS